LLLDEFAHWSLALFCEINLSSSKI
jgi:hypothetical protein